jgi:hypothetical protein
MRELNGLGGTCHLIRMRSRVLTDIALAYGQQGISIEDNILQPLILLSRIFPSVLLLNLLYGSICYHRLRSLFP